MATNQASDVVAVIGGGVIGLCCALSLQRDGWQVLIVDSSQPGQSTAKWSCGQMAVSEIIPISRPGLLKRIPGWLLDQKGPVSLRPTAIPGLASWMPALLRYSTEHQISAIATELAAVTRHTYADYAALLDDVPDTELFNAGTPIRVFSTTKSRDEEGRYDDLMRSLGFGIEEVGGAEIRRAVPGLAGDFTMGAALPNWRTLRDTEAFLLLLQQRFLDAGGQRLEDAVVDIGLAKGHADSIRLRDGGTHQVAAVVVAAGHGSWRFFKRLRIRAPLINIAGYQVVVKNPGVEVASSLVMADLGFGIVPMTRGLQIGGTIEFVGHSMRPNLTRARMILKAARKLLPRMRTDEIEFGVGFRPYLPDTKPIIDYAPGANNVVLAFGHGQLGVTMGATTGRLVCDLVAHRTPCLRIAPFAVSRFGRRAGNAH